MTEENRLKQCCECRDFLWEDTSGYGICAKDNEIHHCGAYCMYSSGLFDKLDKYVKLD